MTYIPFMLKRPITLLWLPSTTVYPENHSVVRSIHNSTLVVMAGSSIIHFSRFRTVIVLATAWMACCIGSNEHLTPNPSHHSSSWCHTSPQRFGLSRLACLRGGGPWRVAPPVADRFDAKTTTPPPTEVVAAKEQLNAFLTSDSRNQFIGTLYL
jgi:hypothetical protein